MDSRYQRIYDVGLLDDLHNFFPSLLYRPELFNNVQDVLGYIQRRTAARFNLFNHGMSEFMEAEARSNPYRNTVHRTPIRPVAARMPEPPEPTVEVELTPNTPLTAALDAAILPLLRNLYMPEIQQHRRVFRGQGRQFQDVIVHATQAQIDVASHVSTADATYAATETICSICQDPIQETEEVRHLNVCRHDFHRACIDNWLLQSSVICPTCRHDIRDLNPVPTARQSPQLTAGTSQGPTGPTQATPLPPPLQLDGTAQDVLQMLFRGLY
jgi:hypothetical protein